jgi:hypothetical protein
MVVLAWIFIVRLQVAPFLHDLHDVSFHYLLDVCRGYAIVVDVWDVGRHLARKGNMLRWSCRHLSPGCESHVNARL